MLMSHPFFPLQVVGWREETMQAGCVPPCGATSRKKENGYVCPLVGRHQEGTRLDMCAPFVEDIVSP